MRLQPEPNLRERNAKVNGVTITVLDTAQILRGKLERAEKSPVRDVFDFASASKGGPGALAIATNCLTKQYAGVIGTIWKTSNKRFANDAADYLEGVTPGWSWPDSVARSTLVRVRYRSGVVPWVGGLRDEPRPSLGAVIVRLDISVTGAACRDPSASQM